VKLADVHAHLGAQGRVEVGERLVEQEQRRPADDRAAHGDALALAAGELLREAIEERVEAEHGGGVASRAPRPRPGVLRSLRPKARLSRTERCG
jgi:hypothetical protein